MPAVVNVGKLYFTDDIMQKEKKEKKKDINLKDWGKICSSENTLILSGPIKFRNMSSALGHKICLS